MAKRTIDQSFTTQWDKASAWAQTQGISQNDILPVYQMDLQRIQTGYTPMSAAERNRALLAAKNPNLVQSVPSDNPQPSNVFNNARHDLASIVTGLEPQHLVMGLFDTVKNTVEGVMHPKTLEGKNLEATAGNWLENTLLSFIPGAYDLGAFLKGDVAHGTAGGFAALADHPLLSLLDVAPASKVAMAGLAHTAIGEVVARAGNTDVTQLGEHGFTVALGKALSNRTWAVGYGVKPGSAAGGIEQLTIGDKIQTWLQNSKIGASAPVQHFVKEYMVGNQLQTGIYQNLMSAAHDAYNVLNPDEKAKFSDIFYRQDRGENIQTLLADPSVTLPVKHAVEAMMDGPVKFLTEQAIAMNDVVGIRRPDGSIGIYSAKHAEAVKTARDQLADVRRHFLTTLFTDDKLVQAVDKVDKAQTQLAAELERLRVQAYALVQGDKSDFIENVKQEYLAPGKKKPVVHVLGKKHEQISALFGPGGLTDQVVHAMKLGEDDNVATLLPVLKERLQKWSYGSVDAKDRPEFQAIAQLTTQLDELVKNRATTLKHIDQRIIGDASGHLKEINRIKLRQKADTKELHDRHVNERAALRSERSGAYRRIRARYEQRKADLTQLANQQVDAAYALADTQAVKATKAVADALYQKARAEEAKIKKGPDSLLARSLKMEKAKRDTDLKDAQIEYLKKERALGKRHDAEVKKQTDFQAHEREYLGPLSEEMRAYVQTVKDFHKAIAENPTDNYRNARLDVYTNSLLESMKNSDALYASMRKKMEDAGVDQNQWEALQAENPAVIKELLALHIDDVYQNPNNFTVEVTDAALQAKKEAEETALESINRMRMQGYNPRWIPQASTFSNPPSGIKAIVGKGVPHVDVAFARANKLVATRHDVVIGVTDAMAQQMKRDAHIDFVTHSIAPRVVTGSVLKKQLLELWGPDGLAAFDPTVGTLPDAMQAELSKMGLTQWKPDSQWGFTLPSWGNENLYLPKGLATALEKTQKMEAEGQRGLLDKTNQLFRYSILGLSPRYTAHILFGGTFLLAVRSTVKLPLYLSRAAKAMRDGSLPEEIYRQPAQEGFGQFNYALREYAFHSGKQVAGLTMQEHIERTQGVLLHKASPLHWLKAAADLNFRFTRYVTRMQTAAAYLDYAGSVDMSGTFFDEVTGTRVPMTRERAVEQAMNHVEQVFGDLRSMAPIERQMAKSIMPFYGWTRHILKYVLTLPADHPWRAMILALIAYENSAAVPKGLPERIQFLFFLGSPDKNGNVSAMDTRFLNPLRDVANYASLGGWIQGLNPAILAPAALMDPQLVYGSTSLYPKLSYNDLYGIQTAGAQGSAIQGLEQFVPQLGAVTPLMQALGQARNLRQANTNTFYKTLFNDLNIPFAQIQRINVKQIAAKSSNARYTVAKQAAQNAFDSGDFSGLAGYTAVPNPLNPDYEITPQALQKLYSDTLARYPGQNPRDVLLPPPTPAGF